MSDSAPSEVPVNAKHGQVKVKKTKEQKEAEKAEKAAAAAAAAARQVIPIEEGGLHGKAGAYGDLVLVQSRYEDDRKWAEVSSLDASMAGQECWIRARVATVRGKGKFAFVVLRRGFSTVQAVVAEGTNGMTREAVKWAMKVPNESVVDIFGSIVKVDQPTKTSQSEVEISISRFFVVSLSSTTLPFQLADAAATPNNNTPQVAGGDGSADGGLTEVNGVITVGQDLRLDNRWIDLRTPANHAIFRLQSRVCQYYRQFFIDRDFIEIHTPKLTPGVSEGGAAVFRLKYFDRDACLAQSPQLYKQMAVTSDLFKVFEIGPVFRMENSNTHRHQCEFTGMDFEMEIKQHYHEVLKVLGDLFVYIFDQITANCQKELAAVAMQYPFTPIKYRRDTLTISFTEAIKLLREAGENIGDEEDFSTPQEKLLGRVMKQKYDVDFYIVDQYPLTARPFYTMPNHENPRFTNSYDVFIRGEEITSGAQRIHDVPLLVKRAEECGIPASNIKDYCESFKYGAWPHGGAGIGLERVVMLYLNLDNIRKTALFPRTPNRLTP